MVTTRKTGNLKALTLALAIFATGQAAAQSSGVQELSGDAAHGYAVFLGTGLYKLDDRQLFVLRIPASWQIRDQEQGKMGVKLLLPAAVGIQNFDSLEDLPGFQIDDVQTVSFVPGVELQFQPSPRWQVKPFAHAGVAWVPEADAADFVFGLGARTNYVIPRGSSQFTIGGEYLLAGDGADDGGDSTINRLSLGAEYKHPVSWSLFSRQTSVHWRMIVYNYIGGLTIKSFPDSASYDIDSELRVGFALSVDPKLKFLGIPVSHLGLGFRVSEKSHAIVIETKFPF